MAEFSDPLKRCTGCREEKPISAFYVSYHNRFGTARYASACKICKGLHAKAYRKRNLERVRVWKKQWYERRGRRAIRDLSYKRMYNTTVVAFDMQLALQNGVCSICGREPEEGKRIFAFDHDHATGYARGVLCGKCNVGLGYFNDDVSTLRAAIDYLLRWQEQHGVDVA